jgi:hypothetical protein
MKSISLTLILFCLLCLLTGNSRAQGPKLPYTDSGACPFECCTYRQWTANKATVILSSMKDGSSIAFRVKKGEKVTAITGVVITTRAGIIKVLQNTTTGENSKLHVKAGDILYLLTYQGEGFYKTWYKGKIFSDAFYENTALKQVNEPQAIWWVKFKNRKGRIGWTRLPENFDNKDSCG